MSSKIVTEPSPRRQRRYRLLDTCFGVRFGDSRAEGLSHPAIAHLEGSFERAPDKTISVSISGDTYRIAMDREVFAEGVKPEALCPLLHAHIFLGAYEATDCLIAFHAAGLAGGDKCVLLPGIAGSGKSTLTAALVACGLTYLSDELTILMRDTHRVRPVPVSMAIKQGSWPILTPYFPDIESLPVHMRDDGRAVRYLAPPPAALPAGEDRTYSAQCIVFPKYRAQARTRLSVVSQADALCRLTEAGYDSVGNLTAGDVGELVDWIARCDCYELQYSRLSEATSQIEKLLLQ